MQGSRLRVLVDAREFTPGRVTGIGRVLEGFVEALCHSRIDADILLAVNLPGSLPGRLKDFDAIRAKQIPESFSRSERALSALTKQNIHLFVSPYPKLPFFNCRCSAVHIIHDILDLTHSAYKKRFRVLFDRLRLRQSLGKAALSWYDSFWSLQQTKQHLGFTGRNPRVRYPAINDSFRPEPQPGDNELLKKHNLEPGYILTLGNGLPHKNLGVLLKIVPQISRPFLFVGVSENYQRHWKAKYPASSAVWIRHIADQDLPAILRNSFCLAQPSTAEGYGYPPLESMACGVPAVVSDIPVLLETTGNQALTADPAEPKTWIHAFDSLEHRSIHQTQVEKGLRWVKPLMGRKGWEKHVSDIEDLLEGG